jgi:hypothetical protein
LVFDDVADLRNFLPIQPAVVGLQDRTLGTDRPTVLGVKKENIVQFGIVSPPVR